MKITNGQPPREGLRVVVAAGGTGGHVFPGIAVAQEVERRGGEVLFLGTHEGIEADEVPRAGFRFEKLRVAKLKRVSLKKRLQALYLAPTAVVEAVKKIRGFAPDAVVGAGGYVSGPSVLAARLLGIPSLILEQNSIPGVTNRVLSRITDRSVVAFQEALDYLPRSVNLGNPVRREIVEKLTSSPTKKSGKKLSLLVIGGSQGARALNDAMAKIAPVLGEIGLRVVHATGRSDLSWVKRAYERCSVEARVSPFIRDMAEAYADCDLVFCRAGATTIAELTLVGKPALLVPFPFAADDHQTANAESLSRNGAAVSIPQGELTAPRLIHELRRFASEPTYRGRMGDAMRALGRPDASKDVVEMLEKLRPGGSR